MGCFNPLKVVQKLIFNSKLLIMEKCLSNVAFLIFNDKYQYHEPKLYMPNDQLF